MSRSSMGARDSYRTGTAGEVVRAQRSPLTSVMCSVELNLYPPLQTFMDCTATTLHFTALELLDAKDGTNRFFRNIGN
jgi:hypothetical protein